MERIIIVLALVAMEVVLTIFNKVLLQFDLHQLEL